MPNDVPDWSGVAAQGQTLLGTITTPGDGVVHTQTFALPSPSTTQAVALRCWTSGGNAPPVEAKIVGDVSQVLYVDLQGVGANSLSDVERWFLPDQQAVCSVQDQGVGLPAKVDFLALNFGPVVTVRTGNIGPPLQVQFSTNGPRAFQSAATSADVAVALAAGGAATVIPAVAAQIVYLFCVALGFDAVSAGNDLNIRDGVGGASKGRISAISVNPPAQDWAGAHMSSGNAVEIFANGGALTPRGTVTYNRA